MYIYIKPIYELKIEDNPYINRYWVLYFYQHNTKFSFQPET